MTHMDDLHEPADDRDWTLDELAERAPVEPEHEPPLDLDAVEDSIRVYYAGSDDDSGKAAEELLAVASGLVAELRSARERIAEFEALEKREEWVITPSRDSLPGVGVTVSCGDKADQAEWLARGNAAQMWRRMLSVHAYEPIDADAPL